MSGSLRDQLLKANLVSKADIQKLEREKRKERKEQGVRSIEQAKQKKQTLFEQEALSKAQADREREQRRLEELKRQQSVFQVKQFTAANALLSGWRGPRRFYFVDRANCIPHLMVSEQTARRLEQGELAIIELPGKTLTDYFVMPAEAALRLKEADPDAVRFLNTKADLSPD